MKGTIKKALMLVLSLAMVLTMSVPVFAGTETTSVTNADALKNAVQQSGTVTLGADITASITIKKGETVTLNLNGKTLTNETGKNTITVEKGATLTVTGTGTVSNVSSGAAALFNNGTASLKGGTFKGDSWYTVVNHGTMTIENGVTVSSADENSSMIENGYYSYSEYQEDTNDKNPSLTINGGTFDGGLTNIKNDDGGIATINGGTFKNAAYNALLNWNKMTINGGDFTATYNLIENMRNESKAEIEAGDLTINGGTFTATPTDDNKVCPVFGIKHETSDEEAPYTAAKTTINGGTFTDRLDDDANKLKITVKGGKFYGKPDDSDVAEGYTVHKNIDGTYSVYADSYINSWTTPLTIKSEWTYGDTSNKPSAKAKYGTVTYKYYDSNKKEIGSTQPTDAGSYYVKAFVAAGKDASGNAYSDLESDYVAFKINKGTNKFTKALTMSSWTYGEKAAEPSAEALYGKVVYTYYDKDKKALSAKPTEAGTYYIKASVAGNANYDKIESDYVKFTINQKTDSLTTPLTMSSWTYGQTASTPNAVAKEGTVEYKYYDKNGKQLTAAPTLPGTYYVTAYVKGDKDRADFESEKVEFKIYRPVLNAKAKRNSSTSEKISWTKVKGADGYVVYYGRCGRSMKKIASTKTARTTVRRHLVKGKNYKYQVKAYKLVDGKKVVISKSYAMHAIANGYNSKYTDAKSVKVADSDITIKLDGSKKIKASLTKFKSGRKLLNNGHAALYRYRSSDKTVAVVTSTGKVAALKEGTCKVYVCAPDGVWKTVKVTVEK